MKNFQLTTLALLFACSTSVIAQQSTECDNIGMSCQKVEYISLGYTTVDFGHNFDGTGFSFGYGQKLSENWGVTGDISVLKSDDTKRIGTNELSRDFKGWGVNIGAEYYITFDFSIFRFFDFWYRWVYCLQRIAVFKQPNLGQYLKRQPRNRFCVRNWHAL